MIQSITSQGLVLYNRNFREDDKLVKIFTEQAGKRMFLSNMLASLSWRLLFSPWCWLDFSYESMMTGSVTLRTIMR